MSEYDKSDQGAVNSRRAQTDAVWFAVDALWSKKVLIGACGLIVACLTVLASFLMTPSFRAEVTVLPRTGGSTSGLMAMIGLATNINIGDGASLEDLYPAIAKSNRVLDRVISGQYSCNGETKSLYNVFGIASAHSSQADSLRAVRKLKGRLTRSVIGLGADVNSGLIRLSVTVPRYPDLAAELANAIAAELDGFIQKSGLLQSQTQLHFVGRRLGEVTVELDTAETNLMGFRLKNRGYADSPRLAREHSDLLRQRDVIAVVWSELKRQHEIAKVEANQERYALDVLDWAEAPDVKLKPRRGRMGVMGLVLGTFFGMLFVLGRSYRKLSVDGGTRD